MQGRDRFTAQEIAELRRLIAEKQTADRPRQKSLRGRMRAIGFYITDFVTDQKEFTASDFDELLERGVIRIEESGEGKQPRRRVTKPRPARPEPAQDSDEEHEQARRARREGTAEQFKPETVDLLLVAEAPPSAVDRYFYFPDVREQDSLFRYVCRGLLGREPTREAKPDLLAELRDRGVFLIDLQEEPRDEAPLSEFVPQLVERCGALAPEWIVLIKTTSRAPHSMRPAYRSAACAFPSREADGRRSSKRRSEKRSQRGAPRAVLSLGSGQSPLDTVVRARRTGWGIAYAGRPLERANPSMRLETRTDSELGTSSNADLGRI